MTITNEIKNLRLQATTASTHNLIKCGDQDTGKTNCTGQLPALLFLFHPNRPAQSAMVQLFQTQDQKNRDPSKHAIFDDLQLFQMNNPEPTKPPKHALLVHRTHVASNDESHETNNPKSRSSTYIPPYLLRGLLRRGRSLPSGDAAEHGARGGGDDPARPRARGRPPRPQPGAPRGGGPPREQERRRGAGQREERGGRGRRRARERGHGPRRPGP